MIAMKVLYLYNKCNTMNKLRTKIVPVRLNEDEEKNLKEKAEKLGLKLSTYLRFKALDNVK